MTKIMDDEEYLAAHVKGLEESVAFFAPGTTKARERFTATSFIENLGIEFNDGELISPDDDPPDVVFRAARFEIKEILDQGRRRHDEYKAELERAKSLTDPVDTLQMFTPKDAHILEIFERCESAAQALENKYPKALKAELDLLFYVNLQRVFKVIETPYPSTDHLGQLGWRSVSFVIGQASGCFFARADAPDFIKAARGRLVHLHPR